MSRTLYIKLSVKFNLEGELPITICDSVVDAKVNSEIEKEITNFEFECEDREEMRMYFEDWNALESDIEEDIIKEYIEEDLVDYSNIDITDLTFEIVNIEVWD